MESFLMGDGCCRTKTLKRTLRAPCGPQGKL